jgi:hypothetical protein
MTKLTAWKMVLAVFVFCAATTIAVPAQTLSTFAGFARSAHSFPVLTPKTAELTTTDVNPDTYFGWSVAISGDTAVVGAIQARVGSQLGAAYVFVEPQTGWTNMTQIATLTSSDASYGFGSCVAVNGDTVVVGALNIARRPGAVYVFVKPSGGWKDMTETAKLTASSNTYLGASVAIDGKTIVSGATDGTSADGKVYVYVEPNGGWKNMTETAQLTYSNVMALGFGESVAISENTVVAGAPALYDYGQPESAAFLFVIKGGGWVNMTQTAILTSSDGYGEDHFGYSVAVSNNTAVVGAPSIDEVYVFQEPTGGWVNMTETARLTSSDSGRFDSYGACLAIQGKVVAIGSPSNNQIGAVYAYVEPKSGWNTTSQYTAKFTVPAAGANSDFAGSIAMGGRAIIAGAPFEAGGGTYDQGAAYVFFP